MRPVTSGLQRLYKAKAAQHAYTYNSNVPGEKDAFQNLYHVIANDMAAYKATLSADEIKRIRAIAQLQFAADFAPDAFGHYLSTNTKGDVAINRLPADDDPMMARVLRIRERDHMYVDLLKRVLRRLLP